MLKAVLLTIALFSQPLLGQGVKVGHRALDFTLKTLAGENVTLSDYRGKVVLLDFWASWCGPCKEEMPYLDRLQQKYGEADLKVLAVNVDGNPKNVLRFVDKYAIELIPLWDQEKKVVSAYDVKSMPTSIIIDRRGRIRYIHSGFRSKEMAVYRKEIELLIAEGRKGSRPRN